MDRKEKISFRSYRPQSEKVIESSEIVTSGDMTTIKGALSSIQAEIEQFSKKAIDAQEANRYKDTADLLNIVVPKKLNWDLKRSLEEKRHEGGLDEKTKQAMADLIRERMKQLGSLEGLEALVSADKETDE